MKATLRNIIKNPSLETTNTINFNTSPINWNNVYTSNSIGFQNDEKSYSILDTSRSFLGEYSILALRVPQ